MQLSNSQISTIESPLDKTVYLHGPMGSGKTTTGMKRLQFLLENGVPAHQILLLFPQRTLSLPYQEGFAESSYSGSTINPTTLGGIARRTIDLFWPLVLDLGLFKNNSLPPTFLTMESAQYYMAHLLQPLLDEEGFFQSVTIQRHRIYSQILDNLNKAAMMGFPHTRIQKRLTAAWVGEPGRKRIYQDAQACAESFREYCFQHSLLDFSLQIELFSNHLWPLPQVQNYLTSRFHHLISDNLEEDAPVTHDFLEKMLPAFDSALLIIDDDAGFRKFLGADPFSAERFSRMVDEKVTFPTNLISPPHLKSFGSALVDVIQGTNRSPNLIQKALKDYLEISFHPFYPDLLRWTTNQVHSLIENGADPDQIVVLSPFLGESLRFSLIQHLDDLGVPVTTHRPSRSLREEPAVQSLLTLASLAHPNWDPRPAPYEMTKSFLQIFDGLDLIRAQLLSKAVYQPHSQDNDLTNFEDLPSALRDRITYHVGSKYQFLKDWLDDYLDHQDLALDHYLQKIFGEVLSQPGYGFHNNPEAGSVSAKLIESIIKFRRSTNEIFQGDENLIGKEYLRMVREGVIASQYIQDWKTQDRQAVSIAPAYTYLMSNRAVDYQFWLDVGSRGWYERIYQPLTHPYVLSRDWSPGNPWTDVDEMVVRKQVLSRLTTGLLRRCRKKVFLGLTAVDQRGYEQKGLLLKSINRVLIDRHQGYAPFNEDDR